MMDFTSYGVLPTDYGFGAQKGAGGGATGGTGAERDPVVTLAVMEDIERQQNGYTTKKWSLAWNTALGPARKTADATYQEAVKELALVRAALARVRNNRTVRVSDLPRAVAKRYADLFTSTGAGKGTGGGAGKGTGGGKGGVGGGQPRPGPASGDDLIQQGNGAGAPGASAGTGEIIAGVSNTTLLLLGGGAVALFLIMRRKGAKTASVFKGI